jgi:2-haloacid dehalogenase
MNRREFLATSAVAGALSSIARDGMGAQTAGPSQPQPADLLVFDTFGTVVDWRSSVIAEGEQLARTKKITVDWAAFADAWRAGYAPSMDRVRKGELPWTKLDVLHRRILDELLARYKIAGLTEAEKDTFNRVWHRLRPWPDSVEGLTRLKQRYVIAPLSNGNLSLLTNMAKHAGLPWDCILSTELVRHYKPDRETYLMPGEFFDLPPSRVMMVAAHAGDLQAARALGLKTAYVSRPLEHGAGRSPTQPPVGQFDFSVKDFRELASALGT